MNTTVHDVKATIRFGGRYIVNRFRQPRLICTPQIAPSNLRSELQVHILTSQRDYVMACWAVVSFYAVSGGREPVVFHDDGTLNRDAVAGIRSLFPGARIVLRNEADAIVQEKFKFQPLLLMLRERLPHLMKILDFRSFSNTRRIIMVDSDVLFLSRPNELLEPGESHKFSRDVQSAYVISPGELKKGTGIDLPLSINCGIASVLREAVDIEMMEWFLRSGYVDLERCSPYVEQTLWALECGRTGFEFLPASYRICGGPGLDGVVAKHYVGAVLNRLHTSRDYFFVEGIPAVRRFLQSRSIHCE
jgi:hypothetical protein